MAHRIQYGEGLGPRWGWNNDIEKPSFTPSVLVRYTKLTTEGEKLLDEGKPPLDGQYPSTNEICHSFVTDGKIQFLGDCTHFGQSNRTAFFLARLN